MSEDTIYKHGMSLLGAEVIHDDGNPEVRPWSATRPTWAIATVLNEWYCKRGNQKSE